MNTTFAALAAVSVSVIAIVSTGCRITHYGPPAGKVAPTEEAVCRSTCERLIEEQAISLDGAKACLASCGSRQVDVKVTVAKSGEDRPVSKKAEKAEEEEEAEEAEQAAKAEKVEKAEKAEKAERVARTEPVDSPCARAPRARSRGQAPAVARPQAACQSDDDCPEDAICESGVCQ